MTNLEFISKRKCWESDKELEITLPNKIKDVKLISSLLRAFLEKETVPFKIVRNIEIYYSGKKATDNLEEFWSHAFVMIQVQKRSFSYLNPFYDKDDKKHYIKVRFTINTDVFNSWQEYRFPDERRWYLELEQIKAWKKLLEKFASTLSNPQQIDNPSQRAKQ